jgi:hypothetical protein
MRTAVHINTDKLRDMKQLNSFIPAFSYTERY